MSSNFTKQNVLDFLRANPVMNLAAVRDDGKPLASVLIFTVEDDFTFTIVSSLSTYKTQALLRNPLISFSVWTNNKMLVQADGVAERAVDDINKYLDKLAYSSTALKDFWPPLLRLPDNEYVLFHIKPTWIRILDLSTYHITEKEPQFVTILNKIND